MALIAMRLETPAECRRAEPYAVAYVDIETRLHWAMMRVMAQCGEGPCSEEALRVVSSTVHGIIGRRLPVEFTVTTECVDEAARVITVRVERIDGLPIW